MEQPGDDMRCVVLRAGEAVDPAVRAAMERRGWSIISTDHELTAMTRLLLLDAVSRDRAAWGLDSPRPTGLVVESPEHWPHLRSMLLAAARYLPDTGVWVVREDGLRRLRLPSPPMQDRAERKSGDRRTTSARYPAGESGVVSPRPNGHDERTGPDPDEAEESGLISSDEINLLLRDPGGGADLGTEREMDGEEDERRT